MNIPDLKETGAVAVDGDLVFVRLGDEIKCAPRWAVAAYLGYDGVSPEEMAKIKSKGGQQ